MGDQEHLLGETSLITTGLLQTLALPHVVWIIKSLLMERTYPPQDVLSEEMVETVIQHSSIIILANSTASSSIHASAREATS